jgi:hypothetical protein
MGNNTIEANEKLAYEICHRWSIEVGGDVEPFFELFHDDATFTTMGAAGHAPYSGRYAGQEGISRLGLQRDTSLGYKVARRGSHSK